MGRSHDRRVIPHATTSVARVCVGVAILMAPWPRSAHGLPSAQPPTSIEPRTTRQKVEVSYLHRVVRSCTPTPANSPRACAAQMSEMGAATSLTFEPVSIRPGVPTPNRRIVVRFSEVPGVQKRTVELAAGEWAIESPTGLVASRLAIPITTTAPSIALRTLSGRCELSQKRCKLVDGAFEQRVTIGR
jgi:hypothetical protein